MLFKLIKRVVTPSPVITLILLAKYKCFASFKSEIELDNFVPGNGSRISSFCKIKTRRGKLELGDRVDIAAGCFLSSSEKELIIGADTVIGPHCTIVANNYSYQDLDTPIKNQPRTTKGTVIGSNVFVGAGSVVLDGSRIGSGSVVAANSVVKGEIPENSVVAGNPAKVLFNRADPR